MALVSYEWVAYGGTTSRIGLQSLEEGLWRGRRMNDMCRDELSRKDCGWLVRGGSAELLW